MAYEYDRVEREDGGGSFLMGLLAGTVLGAGLGMLFAPKAGAEVRKQLSEQATRLRSTAARHGAAGVGENRARRRSRRRRRSVRRRTRSARSSTAGVKPTIARRRLRPTCTIAPRRRRYDRADGDRIANVALGAAALGAAYRHRAHAAAAADGDWSRDDGADGRASPRGWRGRRSTHGSQSGAPRDMMTA